MTPYRLFHLHPGENPNALPRDQVDAFQTLMFKGYDDQAFRTAVEAGLYVHAADIETEKAIPEAIFHATQNVEHGWAEQPYPGIHPTGESRKSTSVGDLVMDPDGRLHACMRVVFKEIGQAPESLVACVRDRDANPTP